MNDGTRARVPGQQGTQEHDAGGAASEASDTANPRFYAAARIPTPSSRVTTREELAFARVVLAYHCRRVRRYRLDELVVLPSPQEWIGNAREVCH